MKTKASDLENGGGFLLDPRFADGILVFATSSQQATCLLDELVVALASVGVGMNENKRKLLTTQAQPMVNGQWSMLVSHKASPFWAQAVKKTCTLVSHAVFKFLSHLAKSLEIFTKCIPVMMVFRFL